MIKLTLLLILTLPIYSMNDWDNLLDIPDVKSNGSEASSLYIQQIALIVKSRDLLSNLTPNQLLALQRHLKGNSISKTLPKGSWNEVRANETIVTGLILMELRSRFDYKIDMNKSRVANYPPLTGVTPKDPANLEREEKYNALVSEQLKDLSAFEYNIDIERDVFECLFRGKNYLGQLFDDENDVKAILEKANIDRTSIDLLMGKEDLKTSFESHSAPKPN